MRITGIEFVGTRTAERAAMARVATELLGLTPVQVEGMDADAFELPDGSTFVVSDTDGPPERTVGFTVEDLDAALAEVRAAGLWTDDEVSANARDRYVHFRAPDGHLYELIERRT
jgi:catechol 2,3-dioxygenase-like lactoylglutathione lyase family enzyme